MFLLCLSTFHHPKVFCVICNVTYIIENVLRILAFYIQVNKINLNEEMNGWLNKLESLLVTLFWLPVDLSSQQMCQLEKPLYSHFIGEKCEKIVCSSDPLLQPYTEQWTRHGSYSVILIYGNSTCQQWLVLDWLEARAHWILVSQIPGCQHIKIMLLVCVWMCVCVHSSPSPCHPLL